MDNARKIVNEQSALRNKKILFGVVLLVVIIVVAIALERKINSRITDVTIMKSEITDEKAIFIPVKKLDTNIIAVRASDGTYRLAFDDCTGCYYERSKHGQFKNNGDNTGLICKECQSEIMYDDMGFLPEESMPYPIVESEIISEEDRFVIPSDYLTAKKKTLEDMRNGKAVNNYSEKND